MPVRSSSVGTSQGSGTFTVPVPAGVVAGDIILLAVSSGGSNTSTTTWPGGFTEHGDASHSGSGQRLRYASKVATASEGASYSISFSPPDHASAVAVAMSSVQGVHATAKSTSGALTAINGANPTPLTAPSFNTPSANNEVLWIGAGYPCQSTTITVPAGMTDVNGTNTQYSNIRVANKVQAAAGATGALAGSLNANGYPMAVAFAMEPGSVPAAPTITSNGGGATAAISVAENTTAVTTVTATDSNSDPITFSISGGADAARFAINASTGVLTFSSAPDFESPTDADANNTYVVIVRASDGTLFSEQTITVTVTDVVEAAAQVEKRVVFML